MKTKQDLLRVMDRRRACQEALRWVKERRSQSAESIGLMCNRHEWLVWLLDYQLTQDSRALFARRLGIRVQDLFYASMVHGIANGLDRRVIDDCWRAWCRS